MEYLISLLLGYAIGSFPTAFLILKKVKNLDITTQGTGNVGAMNTFEVTNSKTIGILVLILDLLKGMLPILILKMFSMNDFSFLSVALIACIFSHCYNPWLKLKGGRGLASAAGGTALIFPFALAVWLILWAIFYLIKKDITIANVVASTMSLLVIVTFISTAFKYAFPQPGSEAILVLFSLGLLLIIISKHTEPLQELFESMKSSRRKN
jgi:acyl phosphate:glycerol-3-phosphate acyltransferase